MAVTLQAFGAAAVSGNGSSFVNVLYPAAATGDIRVILACTSSGSLTTPDGWSLVATDFTVPTIQSYIFWREVSSDEPSGSTRIEQSPAISRAVSLVIRGAASAPPGFTIAATTTASTSLASATTDFGDLGVLCVFSSPAPRTSGYSSTLSRWTATEHLDSIYGGVNSLALASGPISSPGNDELTAALDRPRAHVVIALAPKAASSGTPSLPFFVGSARATAMYVGSVLASFGS